MKLDLTTHCAMCGKRFLPATYSWGGQVRVMQELLDDGNKEVTYVPCECNGRVNIFERVYQDPCAFGYE